MSPSCATVEPTAQVPSTRIENDMNAAAEQAQYDLAVLHREAAKKRVDRLRRELDAAEKMYAHYESKVAVLNVFSLAPVKENR